MTVEQLIICGILVGVLGLLIWGRWRYDVVAIMALIAAVLTGVVPFDDAFSGFGHPATITVALVLMLSRGLAASGATDLLVRPVMAATGNTTLHIAGLAGVAALMSAVMNNVGALALLLPVAMQSAARAERSPSIILMPLAFGSILGGLMTLIGTPPNIIVATYRTGIAGEPFRMFDFTPVGGVCALVGIAFVALVGWRLLPTRRKAGASEDLFQIADYVTEARLVEDSKAAGKSLAEIDEMTEEIDATVIGVVRGGTQLPAPPRLGRIEQGDVLIVEAGPDDLDRFVSTLGLEIVDTDQPPGELLRSDQLEVIEAVVTPRSPIEGRTLGGLALRSRFGINVLAASRQGRPHRRRLRSFQLRAGDVLLLQGPRERLSDLLTMYGWLPLASRGVAFGQRGRGWTAIGLFGGAIALATLGLMPLQIAFGLAVVGMVVTNLMAPRDLYAGVDWSVIVLLGALLPVGGALETTGTTELIAGTIARLAEGTTPVVVLVALLVVTMTLSDVLNNAATVVVMAPIAAGLAAQFGVSADPFLMAVAVGGSSAFLTPIGHQNNTLVMGPGGYAFGDYWRMGLPLEVLIVLVAIPMILLVWPL